MGWYVVGDHVYDEIDRFASDDVRDEFYLLVEALSEDGGYPGDHPLSVAIQPVQDLNRPNSFSAPFDNGFLSYQVMKDQPVIKLVEAIWMEP